MKRAAESLPQPLRADADTKTLKHVFVVGFPRSGTTWMMWLLAKLPSVVAVQQSGMFHALRDIEGWWRTDHSFSRQADGSSECDGGEAAGGLEFVDSTTVLSPDDYFELVGSVCGHVHTEIAAKGGSRVVVEQTPENMEFEASIRRVFPGAYFLHVIRDPRDTCVSMMRAAKAWENELPGRVIHVANRWNEYMRRADKLKESTDRYVEVRYEDLKTNGAAELERVARALDLEVDSETCQQAVKACALDRMRQRTDLPKGFFGQGQSGGWRDQLSGSDVRVLEYIARADMLRHGYALEHKRSSVKPMRLVLHEALARGLAKWRGPWLRRSKRLRTAVGHVREEIRYTQLMRK